MRTICKNYVPLIYKLIGVFFSDESYICFALSCGFSSSDPNKVLNHTLNCQWTQTNETFGIRLKLFDESVGTLVYRSIHSGQRIDNITLKKIKEHILYVISHWVGARACMHV